MMSSEEWFPLFGIMLWPAALPAVLVQAVSAISLRWLWLLM